MEASYILAPTDLRLWNTDCMTENERISLTLNGEPREIPSPATITSLLEVLGMAGRHVAVERNRELVPKRLHSETLLSDGDTLEIVTLVGGG